MSLANTNAPSCCYNLCLCMEYFGFWGSIISFHSQVNIHLFQRNMDELG